MRVAAGTFLVGFMVLWAASGAAQTCADPTRTILAGLPGQSGCLQFTDPDSCLTAWIVGDSGPASCFYNFSIDRCVGCGVFNENSGLCINTCITDSDDDGVYDGADNCPDDPNPLEMCTTGDDCLGPTNSCDLVSGFCTEQNDNEGDGTGDVCDPDDDNDGANDPDDNCPIDANPFQEDSDFDGLGDACDASFDGNTASDYVEDVAANAVNLITAANPAGGNGLISKLTGKGGVTQRVANAVGAFDAGLIDLSTYLAELQAALDKLDSFDNQLAAKINNGQIVEPEASPLLAASAEIRTSIDALIANAGS